LESGGELRSLGVFRHPRTRRRRGTRCGCAAQTGRPPRQSGARYRGRCHWESPTGSQRRSAVASHRRRRARRAGAVAPAGGLSSSCQRTSYRR
jgi:hypothetical protein